MPPGTQESGQQPTKDPEEQSLMASSNPRGKGDDAPAPELKVKTFNGRRGASL